MRRRSAYESIEKRSFENALMRLLLTEYGMAGGRRIAKLLVEDVQKLIEEFYPDLGRAASGMLVWTCTADEGKKAVVGKPTEEYKTITLKLPLITQQDLRSWADKRPQSQKAQNREQAQVARLIKSAAEQGGLLTIAEVSVMTNRSYEKVSDYIHQWQDETGEMLPLKGYRMDQGASPTHKGEIVRLFEQGMEPPDIARKTSHDPRNVERYLKDYERVLMLLRDHKNAAEISTLISRGKKTVLEYIRLAQELHPELFQN